MTLAQSIGLALNASIFLLVFALGLQSSQRDATYVFRHPALLIRSLVSMSVVMPLFAILVAALTNLHPAIKIAILALAVSPVPPILPKKQVKAGGTSSYAVGLLFSAAVLAILVIPVTIGAVDLLFGKEAHVPLGKLARILLTSVILPLAAGMLVRTLAVDIARRIAHPISYFATALLVVAVLPVLVGAWPQLVSMVGNGTLVVLALFTLVGVVVGHLLGGPDPDNRTVLALATSTRHPGIALAVATLDGQAVKGVLAVILWHAIVSSVVSVPYVRRHIRSHAATPGGTG
ncbi:bile acid:sodium symporter family protein [Mesorhizobium koreense]|uniref:bile acid:sodium symporter family protein n=1 Tax=Mesorhizobium koreense TaxID=3074855 RepID=UPI00287B813E|nr:Na+-dependent transporter [Mesorhizobium sp. WR6]